MKFIYNAVNLLLDGSKMGFLVSQGVHSSCSLLDTRSILSQRSIYVKILLGIRVESYWSKFYRWKVIGRSVNFFEKFKETPGKRRSTAFYDGMNRMNCN